MSTLRAPARWMRGLQRMRLSQREIELHRVAQASVVVQEAKKSLREAVDKARFEGATWFQIGEVLGVSRQWAHQKYGGVDRDQEAR